MTVLEFTKPKPGNAERRAIRVEGPDGWLRAVLADAPLEHP
jgi:hypothetical protein